jgi:hypothetical protein
MAEIRQKNKYEESKHSSKEELASKQKETY